MTTETDRLIKGLLNPKIYPHTCSKVELVETHISWVLLTGLRAYKIKKPVDLGFVNFTTLERRRFYCEEELRLNRRLAPDLYLEVVPITGTREQPRIGGDGPVIEYAVCMVQFDQEKLLSKLPATELQPAHIDNLADRCAEFHAKAMIATSDKRFGSPEQVMLPVRTNFEVLRKTEAPYKELIKALETQAEGQFERLHRTFETRKQNGMIRECHGDLHLGNMFLQGNQVTIFDGIEFNEDFRWIDIISDIAFTVMDLEDRGYHSYSNRFLNRWLERTGDYTGLSVLTFYYAYRAVVRAKVDAIRLHQSDVSSAEQRHLEKDCRGYLELAQHDTDQNRPALLITMGPSGSGKTTITQQLLEATNMIRIRSDVERKRLHGLKSEDCSDERLKSRMYSADATRATYDRLKQLAAEVIEAGFSVIVDATFLKRSERESFSQLANNLGVPFLIIKCEADEVILKERIKKRQQQSSDASEADENVLDSQLRTVEWLDSDEEKLAVDANMNDLPRVVMERITLARS